MGTRRLNPGVFPVISVLLAGALYGLYAPGLSGPLVLDDYTALKPLLDQGTLPADWRAQIMSPTGPLGRPLAMLSFFANLYWHGGELWWWKATNVCLHGLTGLLLLLVARAIFALCGARIPYHPVILALFVAALWILHPLHPSTVLYTVQRMTQLSALFVALGMLSYLHGRTCARPTRQGRLFVLMAFVLCLPFAALSKENGLLLPAFLAILEFTLVRRLLPTRDISFVNRLFVVFLLVPVLVVGGYYAFNFESAVLNTHLRRGFTFTERVLTESRILVLYLFQIVAPAKARLGFFHDDIVLSTSLLEPPTTLAAVAGLLVLLAAAMACRKRAPLVCCGVLWFFVGHSMEASVVPLELMFEHRNYLPSFGILLAITGGIAGIQIERSGWLPAAGCAVLVLAVLVTASIVRDWRDDSSMYVAFYRAHPSSPSAASQLAEMLAARGHLAEARAVIAPLPGAGPLIHRWYLDCREHGTLGDDALSTGIFAHERAVTTYAVTGLIELGKLGLDDRCQYSAERFLALLKATIKRPIVIGTNRQKLTLYAAHFAWKLAAPEEAFALLDQAAALRAVDPVPLLLRAEWKLEQGDVPAALAALARAESAAERSFLHYSRAIARTRKMIVDAEGDASRQ